jgi:hypothetical protein
MRLDTFMSRIPQAYKDYGQLVGPDVMPGTMQPRHVSGPGGSGRPDTALANRSLTAEIARLGADREGLQQFVSRSAGTVGNAEDRLRKRLSANASGVAAHKDQMVPTSFGGALDSATRRTKARQGIVNRGDEAIRNQSLRDRISVAQASATRRGTIQNALQNAANIREGVNVGVGQANQRARESRAHMFGSITGGLSNYLYNRNKPTTTPTPGVQQPPAMILPQSIDQGTSLADEIARRSYSSPDPGYA